MNELAEEDNYSTTSITTKTRSKTSNSFKPISLSSIKDKQKPFNSKESTEQQPESNISSKQISTQTCHCHSKTKDNRSWICCSLCKDYSCAAISAKDIFFKKTKLCGPFLWMGFNWFKSSATSRRQFTFYH